MFGGSIVGMFDITFGTLTAGLGDYSVAPTVQPVSYTHLDVYKRQFQYHSSDLKNP